MVGALFGIPVAMVLEQVWISIAPLGVALSLGSYQRRQMERHWQELLIQQQIQRQQWVDQVKATINRQTTELQASFKTVHYQLIYDRSQSRQIFLRALQEAEKFAIFVCPGDQI